MPPVVNRNKGLPVDKSLRQKAMDDAANSVASTNARRAQIETAAKVAANERGAKRPAL